MADSGTKRPLAAPVTAARPAVPSSAPRGLGVHRITGREPMLPRPVAPPSRPSIPVTPPGGGPWWSGRSEPSWSHVAFGATLAALGVATIVLNLWAPIVSTEGESETRDDLQEGDDGSVDYGDRLLNWPLWAGGVFIGLGALWLAAGLVPGVPASIRNAVAGALHLGAVYPATMLLVSGTRWIGLVVAAKAQDISPDVGLAFAAYFNLAVSLAVLAASLGCFFVLLIRHRPQAQQAPFVFGPRHVVPLGGSLVVAVLGLAFIPVFVYGYISIDMAFFGPAAETRVPLGEASLDVMHELYGDTPEDQSGGFGSEDPTFKAFFQAGEAGGDLRWVRLFLWLGMVPTSLALFAALLNRQGVLPKLTHQAMRVHLAGVLALVPAVVFVVLMYVDLAGIPGHKFFETNPTALVTVGLLLLFLGWYALGALLGRPGRAAPAPPRPATVPATVLRPPFSGRPPHP